MYWGYNRDHITVSVVIYNLEVVKIHTKNHFKITIYPNYLMVTTCKISATS